MALRNDLVHGKGWETIAGSAKILSSYANSLKLIKMSAARGLCVTRGRRKYMKELKGLCVTTGSDRISEEVVRTVGNWVKMNSDASFCPLTGAASAGVVIRDNSGKVLLTAWRTLKRCGSAEEAEAEACPDSVRLVAEWIRQHV
jgi:hypothetical protein